jgi:hypothetical protein
VVLLASSCGRADDVDLNKLDVGPFSTAVRVIPNQPSLPNGVVLEGIRMSDAVADTSQFNSSLTYLWQAGPIRDTASSLPFVGVAGKRVLDRLGWVAGYRAHYADRPRPPGGDAPPSSVRLSIMLLRFPDDAAARQAAAALELVNWDDFGQTVAAPLPTHPEIAARYTPGTGALLLDTEMGPFVLRLALDAAPDGIEKRIGELDAVVDEEHTLLQSFAPTPVGQIPALPSDPDGLLARMVATDPARAPAPSSAFAVYGATGALRDQTPAMRKERRYEQWGVQRFAISGDQRLYRLPDNRAAKEMAAAFVAESQAGEREIDDDRNLPETRCFRADPPSADAPAYSCRMVFDNIYTVVRAGTEDGVKEMAAAQYALLATR